MADNTTENVVAIEVDTSQAVKTIGDLKREISDYKKQLNELSVTDDEYAETVFNLTTAQNELRIAMNGGAKSMEQLEADAKGLGTSYNSLVNQMANLKKAWRSTTDEATRKSLGEEILKINTRLKEMDASTGNFQRNVGNYTQGVSDALKGLQRDIPDVFGTAKKGIKGVSDGLALMGKQPVLQLVFILSTIISKITDELKENETAMEAIRKVGKALQPVMDALTVAVQWLADKLGEAADWFVQLLGNSSETFKAIISGAVGVGNVILQAVITPFKTAIEAVKGFGSALGKVFKGDFSGALNDAKAAGQNIGDAIKNGFSVSANFEKGQEVAAQFIEGLGNGKAKAKERGKEVGNAYKEGVEEALAEDDALDYLNASEKEDEAQRKANEKLFADLNEKARIREEANAKIVAAEQAVTDALKAEDEKRKQDAKDAAEKMKKAWEAGIAGTANLLSTLADVYEANSEADEKNAGKVKALRIASATIEMLQGAVTAFSSAFELGPIAGPIVGAINAAAVTAAGLANIAKIRSVSTSGKGNTSVSPTKPAITSPQVSAPAQATASPLALATMATDTQTLNAIGSQRVYILASDIQASDNARKVQVAETTF